MKEKDIKALGSLVEAHKNEGIKNIKIVFPQGEELNINGSQVPNERVIITAKYLKERIKGQKKFQEEMSGKKGKIKF